jgi:KaiC/GvpD/RAD55 family RecA-like ATPase
MIEPVRNAPPKTLTGIDRLGEFPSGGLPAGLSTMRWGRTGQGKIVLGMGFLIHVIID